MPTSLTHFPLTRLLAIVLAVLCLLPWWGATARAQAVDIGGGADTVALVESMQVLRQPSGTVSPASTVLAQPGWVPATIANRNASWKSGAVWLTGEITNTGAQPVTRWIVLQPWRIPAVEMLALPAGSSADTTGPALAHVHAGTRHPRSSRNTPISGILPITLAPGESVRLLLRAEGSTVPTTFVDAWTPGAYTRHQTVLLIGEALLVAVVLTLLVLLALTRDFGFVLMGVWMLVSVGFSVTFYGQIVYYLLPQTLPWAAQMFTLFGALSYCLFAAVSGWLLRVSPRNAWALGVAGLSGLALLLAMTMVFIGDVTSIRYLVNSLGLAMMLVWPVMVWRNPLPAQPGARRLRTMLVLYWIGMVLYGVLARGGPLPPWVQTLRDYLRVELLTIVGVMLLYHGLRRQELQTERQRTDYLAFHDALTGLPNRVRALAVLQQTLAAAPEPAAAVLLLDLDRFKQINDTHGHAQGDRLLREVATRLQTATGSQGTACRLSGDEFMVILPGVGNPGRALDRAQRLRECLLPPFELDEGVQVRVGGSVGVAVSPAQGRDGETLMRHADMALHEAKLSGENGVRLFDTAMRLRQCEQVRLREALDVALERGELALHVQPQMRLEDGQVSGAEVLLRWQLPNSTANDPADRVAVPPAQFIPIAEVSGQIVPIGAWVLREACRQAVQWPAPLVVSVNVSAVQVHSGRLLADVQRALAESGLPAHRLELELTESVLVLDRERETALGTDDAVLGVLERLRLLGVQIAIDDFGTGYASLSYLHRLPVDRLKIDRSFIARLADTDLAGADRSLVGAVVQIARSLGLPTVAEGVESLDLLPRLTALGCDAVQGYAIARPMPVEAFAGWYAARSAVEVTPA